VPITESQSYLCFEAERARLVQIMIEEPPAIFTSPEFNTLSLLGSLEAGRVCYFCYDYYFWLASLRYFILE
jgi:hypothetical protein